jgi:pantothenate kinase type III
MKKVIKFKFEDKEGFLSVVDMNHHYYALIQKDTPKVSHIIKTKKLLISYELKNPHYQEVDADVLFDDVLIRKVYHQLEIEKNLYFKQLDDSLCVIEIAQEHQL